MVIVPQTEDQIIVSLNKMISLERYIKMKIQQIHSRLLQYIVLSMLIIVSLSKDLNAQSIEYKNFIMHPPTVDPTYGKPIPAIKHRSGPIADWIWCDSTSNEQKVYFRF